MAKTKALSEWVWEKYTPPSLVGVVVPNEGESGCLPGFELEAFNLKLLFLFINMLDNTFINPCVALEDRYPHSYKILFSFGHHGDPLSLLAHYITQNVKKSSCVCF